MNLKAKAYVESQKTTAQKNLSTRQAALEAKGMNAKDVEKDPQIKKLKADIRKANQRLVALLAELFEVPKRSVELVKGEKSRNKVISIKHPQKLPDWIST